jgi:hypothetical protein
VLHGFQSAHNEPLTGADGITQKPLRSRQSERVYRFHRFVSEARHLQAIESPRRCGLKVLRFVTCGRLAASLERVARYLRCGMAMEIFMRSLATSAGLPIADNQNSLTAGPRGPVLLEDYQLLEKLAHQNRERIPERTVHAKSWVAFGTLTVTNDITKYTRAKIFAGLGKKTDLLIRFSPVAGELGATPRRTGRPWIYDQVLYRGKQLGPR